MVTCHMRLYFVLCSSVVFSVKLWFIFKVKISFSYESAYLLQTDFRDKTICAVFCAIFTNFVEIRKKYSKDNDHFPSFFFFFFFKGSFWSVT